MEKDYNTQRSQLFLPEYGRIVQRMVDHCCEIADREERTKAAYTLINIIEGINPSVKEEEDYKRKLWDLLYMMSEFKLDVDGPYPKPTKEVINKTPDIIPYSSGSIKYRHYGKITEKLFDAIEKEEDPQKKIACVVDMANYMKRSYIQWKKELIPDEIIGKEIQNITDGEIELPDGLKLGDYRSILSDGRPKQQQGNKKKKAPAQQQNNPQKKKKKH